MTPSDWSAIGLSLQCAFLSSLLNLPWGIFWGWILVRKNFRGKLLLQTLLYVPLVLPPVVTGYFLLTLLSPYHPIGKWILATTGWRFVFDWKGAVLASWIVSSPFMIQAVKQAMENRDQRYEWAAANLGANPWKVFTSITLPLAWPGIVSGFFLVFARSLGEFGATIIVAGNIPGRTQTLPLAIFHQIEMGQKSALWPLLTASIVLAYFGLAMSHWPREKRS